MYIFEKTRNVNTREFEPCVTFFNDKTQDYISVTLPTIVQISRVMNAFVHNGRPLEYFQIFEESTRRLICFSFSYKAVSISNADNDPVLIPIDEFEDAIRHC